MYSFEDSRKDLVLKEVRFADSRRVVRAAWVEFWRACKKLASDGEMVVELRRKGPGGVAA